VATVDKAERLLNLISTLLSTTRPLTAEELRARVPGYPEAKLSFRRAFERDKDDLREMGVPLVLEPIEGMDPPAEGYRIDRSRYYLTDPGFDPDELAALHLARQAVRLDGLEGPDALWKLGGVVDGTVVGLVDGGTDRGGGGAVASLPADPNLATLFQACAERCQATFTYNDEIRLIDPHRVGFQRGHWYLTGFDHQRQDERNFRLDRIADQVTLGRPGGYPRVDASSGLPGDPWRMGEGPEVIARLRVDGDQVAWATSQLGEATVTERRPDGSATFEVAVTNWPAFRSFVLGFLDRAELLGPPEQRQEIMAWLSELAGERRP
jgi:proteasome accessory factor B